MKTLFLYVVLSDQHFCPKHERLWYAAERKRSKGTKANAFFKEKHLEQIGSFALKNTILIIE
ncbi:hypothetical protein CPZ25_020125 [Eubacterium maltosivorans]|uniref:Uncharacterized protein n=1 Tax=Eubacterium maltosivorans TaxID=2041044 RepID=A0A4P9CCX5_EUBML|nr:hypothetical protein CPZ25_020125 [Eubacterium maltosivorans]